MVEHFCCLHALLMLLLMLLMLLMLTGLNSESTILSRATASGVDAEQTFSGLTLIGSWSSPGEGAVHPMQNGAAVALPELKHELGAGAGEATLTLEAGVVAPGLHQRRQTAPRRLRVVGRSRDTFLFGEGQ